jgi:CheY-like chemotaxis protein
VIDEPLPPLSVLVIEDDQDGADSTATLLQMYGCRVVVAQTGHDALEFAANDPPDVAILDIRLPDLDGWEVARWLREQAKGTGKAALLIAVTGCGSDVDRQRSTEVGIHLHLVKPVEPAVLIGVLRRFARVLASGSDGN